MVQKDLSGLELTTYIWDIVSDNLVPIGCELSVLVFAINAGLRINAGHN